MKIPVHMEYVTEGDRLDMAESCCCLLLSAVPTVCDCGSAAADVMFMIMMIINLTKMMVIIRLRMPLRSINNN